MEDLEILRKTGKETKTSVDSFYAKNGSRGTARPGDLFFLAQAKGTLLGCVRFCVEEGTPMLRTMMIEESYRKQGIGRKILSAFVDYLDQNSIKNVFCIPYAHLERFYEFAGFQKVENNEIPGFLQERMRAYLSGGKDYICMRRP